MRKRLAVLAAGSLGASIGADLARAGHDVVLIDQWPAQVEAMKSGGICVEMKEGVVRTPVRALHLCDLASTRDPFDIVFLVSKVYDTRWMAELIKPYIANDGVLVAIQNGMTEEALTSILGDRHIGCAIELAARLHEPGRIVRNTSPTRTWLALGEFDGRMTARLEEAATILKAAGSVELTDNIRGVKWNKLVANCMVMGLSGMLGIYNWQVAETPERFRWCMQTGRESLAVGLASGLTLGPLFGMTAQDMLAPADEMLEKNVRTILENITRECHSCIYHDHVRGRRNEVDWINGLVVEKGRALGIPTPANEAIVLLSREIEMGRLRPSLDNEALLDERWNAAF